MKNIYPVLGIALLMIIFFAGCASKQAQEKPKETTTTVPETTTTTTTTTTSTTTTTTTSTTTTLPKEKCWDGTSYKYLNFDIPQLRKFCLCAQGTFAYKSYVRAANYAPAYSYIDYRKNDEWSVRRTPSAYSPVYYVICSDGLNYWTNETYYR